MSQNVTDFTWTRRRELAALEVARDLLPDEAIATAAGITRRTLTRWKTHPDFQTRVIAHRALWREQIAHLGLRDRENRIRSENARWKALQRVIDERAADPMMEGIPGGTTGLIVERIKILGPGEIVREYTVDTPLLREMRDLEMQAAKDLGQWVERSSVSHDDLVFARDYAKGLGMSEEEAERIAGLVVRWGLDKSGAR